MFKTPVALLLATIAVAGCENAHSRLDGVQTAAPAPAKAPVAPGVSPVSSQADHSGDTETRLRRLEDNYAKYAEALDFLGKVYAQQKAQQAQQEAQEPDPTAVFAVGVKDDVAL